MMASHRTSQRLKAMRAVRWFATQRRTTMGAVNLPIQLAPENLTQPILSGWNFSLFSVSMGQSSDDAVEKTAIQNVGSYGRQIGHLAEALEVVIDHFKLLDSDMTAEQKDKLQIFLGDVAAVRNVKRLKKPLQTGG
jgi:hypothetical protein